MLRVQPQHRGVHSVRLGRAAALDELYDEHPRSAQVAARTRDPERRKLLGNPAGLHAGFVHSFAWTSDTQLTPGVYYLTSGMSITGSASLTCPTCTGGQGVLLYIAGGAVTFAGSAKVNLPAATTGLYKGILMFQARSDTNEVKFAGNSGGSPFCTMSGTQFGNCLNGIVYVPNSMQVTLATGSASLATKAVVAQNIKVSSSVTIG